jgi:hypothetical protein
VASAVAGVLVVAVGADLFVQSLPWQRAAVGDALLTLDHRPRPTQLRGSGGARGELSGFSPNRLVYVVSSPREGALVFPLRYGKSALEWEIDAGDGAVAPRAWKDKLALDLPPGERLVVLRYRPKYLDAGLALSTLTLLFWVGDTVRRSRRRT